MSDAKLIKTEVSISRMAAKKEGSKANNMSFHIDQKTLEKYEGMCIGLKGNKVVVSGKNAGKVLRELLKKGPGEEITFASIPKRDVTIVI